MVSFETSDLNFAQMCVCASFPADDVESLLLIAELRLHGVLGLMGLKHQRGRLTQRN